MIEEIRDKLKQPFPAADHLVRDLPGGNQWFYVPWQKIRSRLHQACPDWEVKYSDPQHLGDYCYVRCTLTIAGVSREAVGNAKIELFSRSGNDMSRGTPIERAIADAFKNAAESFGVCSYLDDQNFVINYLKSQADFRGVAVKRKNDGMMPSKSQVNK